MRIAHDEDCDDVAGDDDAGTFYLWTLSAIAAGGRTVLTSNRSGPFSGRNWTHEIAAAFASKPGLLAVTIEAAEGTPHTPCAVNEEGPQLTPAQEAGIESLFLLLAEDRSLASYVQNYLERLGVWPRYEDRFLDLFSKRNGS